MRSILSFAAALFLAAALNALPANPPAKDMRLISTAPNKEPRWMTESQIEQLSARNDHFIDITDTPDLEKGPANFVAPEIPSTVTQQAVVRPILEGMNTNLMKEILPPLTKCIYRFYKSTTGADSSKWVQGQIERVAKTANAAGLTITVNSFGHTFLQPSIIARIEGQGGNQDTVIVGAHQDSTGGFDAINARAPGADDDGSGSVTIFEAFRAIVSSGFKPTRPVEFQWYAGEEAGLLGSQAIAQDYKTKGRSVAGMLQLDMTMYPLPQKDVGIVTDYTDPKLTTFLRELGKAYVSIPLKDMKCGYGCSDHASWNRAGYPSAFPFESSNLRNNRFIHTAKDDLNTIDYDHGLHFAKLAVGFVVEMAH